jgi:hypothetical protein
MGVLDPNDAKDRAIALVLFEREFIDELQAGHWYVNSNPRYEIETYKASVAAPLLHC